MVAKNEAFKALHKRSQNPLKKKKSLLALCRKLIRILQTLGIKQREYNSMDVMGPMRFAQIKQVAA
jgi:transposase